MTSGRSGASHRIDLEVCRREAWRLASRDLADRAGVTPKTLARFWSGGRISLGNARRIVEALGLAFPDVVEVLPTPE